MLKYQDISIHSAAQIVIVLEQFHTEIWDLQEIDVTK